MDPHRFHLATRIHFALLRQYGEDVGVTSLLKGSPEAREALWVCEASDDRELAGLASKFMRPHQPAAARRNSSPPSLT